MARSKKKRAPTLPVWDNLKETHRHIVSLVILAVVALGFFAPVNFEGKQLAGSDAVQSRAAAQSVVEYERQTGDEGLWATNVFSGMPAYFVTYSPVVVQADIVTKALRRIAYPTFYFLLLLAGMYVLAFVLTKRSLPSLLAAIAFGLTTYIPIILHAGHNTKFVVLAWTPWIILSFIYVLRKPGALGGLIFAAVLALSLRANHPQITYNTFFLLGIWWLAEGVGAIKAGKSRSFAVSTVWLAIGTGLALLMVAQPLLPRFEYKAYSMRGGAGVPVEGASQVAAGSGLAFEYAMGWSQGLLEMLTYLIAGALGGGPETYWGDKLFTSGPHYLGGIVLALALVAIFGKRSRTTTSLAVAVFLIALFALGKNAYWLNRFLFDHVPFFNSFRAPEIWLHMFELGVAILAGIGAAWLLQGRYSEAKKRAGWAGFGGVFVVTLVLLLVGPGLLSFEKPDERERLAYAAAAQNNTTPDNPQVQAAVDRYIGQLKDERVRRFQRDAGRTVIFLGFSLLGLLLFFRRTLPASALTGILVLIVLIDLWGMGKRYLPSESFVEGGVRSQIPEYPFDSFIKEKVEEAGGPGRFRTVSLERSPTDWARPAYHYEIASGYHAAKLRLYQDLLNHLGLGGQSGIPDQTMLDLTATRFVVGRRPPPGTTPAFRDESTGLLVFERAPERWERTHFVDSVVVVAGAGEAVEALKDPAFDRHEVAVVRADPGSLAGIDSTSTADVELLNYNAHEVEWRVNTDGRRLLVSSEIYYPAGWSATIDGAETDILQTNHAFRGVVVPEGEHLVRMRFRPESHYRGVLISAAATIFVYGTIAILIGLRFIRRRRSGAEAG